MEAARLYKPVIAAESANPQSLVQHLLGEALRLRSLARAADAAPIGEALSVLASQCDAAATVILSQWNGTARAASSTLRPAHMATVTPLRP